MPHYYDNYSHPYHEEYPVDPYSPRSTNRQQPLPPPARHGQYPFRPRRYSQSQLYDSTPDINYPIHIAHQQRQGLRRQSTWDAARGISRHPMRRHPSYVSAHSSLLPTQPQQRQDPRMFQDPHQYEIRQRRSSTGNYPSQMDHGYYDGGDYDYDDHADNDHSADVNAVADSDDDSLNTLEMLALENAKRNENPLAATPSPFDPDNLTIPLSAQVNDLTMGQQQHQHHPHFMTHEFGLDDNTNVTNDRPPMVSSGTLSEPLTDSTAVSSSQQQPKQQQHQIQSHTQQQPQQGQNESSKDPSKKRRWPLSYLFRKSSTGSNFSKASYNFLKTPSPSNSLSLSSNSSDFSHHSNDLSNNSNNRSISNSSHGQTIPPSMLSKQKQKQKQPQPSIVTFRNPLAPSSTDPDQHQQQRVLSDAEKTALLDYIWAFKAPQVAAQLVSPDTNANVWTGFDYKNQELITNHAMALLKTGGDQTTNTAAATVHDPGLELFDSHIRKGTLPFLVVVSQQMAYYPTSNNTIDKIEIKCLPNTKDTVLLRKKKNGMS